MIETIRPGNYGCNNTVEQVEGRLARVVRIVGAQLIGLLGPVTFSYWLEKAL